MPGSRAESRTGRVDSAEYELRQSTDQERKRDPLLTSAHTGGLPTGSGRIIGCVFAGAGCLTLCWALRPGKFSSKLYRGLARTIHWEWLLRVHGRPDSRHVRQGLPRSQKSLELMQLSGISGTRRDVRKRG